MYKNQNTDLSKRFQKMCFENLSPNINTHDFVLKEMNKLIK